MENSKQFTVNSTLLVKWLPYLLGLLGVLLLAIVLRTYNLLSLPMFVDEAIYVRWAQIMKADETLRFLPLTDGKQPLFMWVIIPFFKLFNDPLIAGRMVSVISGVLSAVGVFLLTTVLFRNKTISLIAMFFYTISPYNVFFNRMALVDSMLALFGIWSLCFGVLTARFLRFDFAMITGFFIGAGLLTKSPAMFFIGLFPLVILLTPRIKSFLTRAGKIVWFWATAGFISYAMYSVLKLGPGFQMVSLRNKDYLFSFSDILKHPLNPIFLNFSQFAEWVLYLIPILFSVLAVVVVFISMAKKHKKEIIVLSLWLIIPSLVEIEVARVFTARYLLFAIFPIFILSAVAAYGVVTRWKKPALFIIVLFCFRSLYLDYLIINEPEEARLPRNERAGYLENWTAGTGVREAASFIKEEHNKNPDEHIVVGSEGTFGVLPNGLEMYLADLQNVTVKGHSPPDLFEIDPSLINAKESKDKVYLVINASRFHMSSDKVGLKVLQEYPKAVKPDGTRDKLVLFEMTDNAVNLYYARKGKDQTSE